MLEWCPERGWRIGRRFAVLAARVDTARAPSVPGLAGGPLVKPDARAVLAGCRSTTREHVPGRFEGSRWRVADVWPRCGGPSTWPFAGGLTAAQPMSRCPAAAIRPTRAEAVEARGRRRNGAGRRGAGSRGLGHDRLARPRRGSCCRLTGGWSRRGRFLWRRVRAFALAGVRGSRAELALNGYARLRSCGPCLSFRGFYLAARPTLPLRRIRRYTWNDVDREPAPCSAELNSLLRPAPFALPCPVSPSLVEPIRGHRALCRFVFAAPSPSRPRYHGQHHPRRVFDRRPG